MTSDDFPDLSFSLDELAEMIFEDWIECVKEQVPHRLNYDKSRHYQPGNAVRESIITAWKSIADKEIKRRDDAGWCRGFLLGFLESNLGVSWSNEFLERSEAYKNAMWLKAILTYLDTFEEPRSHINRLYTALIDDTIVENPSLSPDDLQAHHLVSDVQLGMNWELHRPYLEKHLVQDVTKAINAEKHISLPNLYIYFTHSELSELICKNPYL